MQDAASDVPEELDGYQLARSERTVAAAEASTVTYSVVEMEQSCEDQEEEM